MSLSVERVNKREKATQKNKGNGRERQKASICNTTYHLHLIFASSRAIFVGFQVLFQSIVHGLMHLIPDIQIVQMITSYYDWIIACTIICIAGQYKNL